MFTPKPPTGLLRCLPFFLAALPFCAQAQEFSAANGTALPSFDGAAGTTLAPPQFTVAGTLPVPQRDVRNLNVGWRFFKGDVPAASARDFDDSSWATVNVPHGIEILPETASGGVNYRGPVWYRKTFSAPWEMASRRVALYFEGVMGKAKIFVNGKLAAEHFGGYLPIVVDVSGALEYGKENVVAVRADNADDVSYPPGKPQDSLDFCYFGGIYRDVFLIATDKTRITDANEAVPARAGDFRGVFLSTRALDLRKGEVRVGVKVNAENPDGKNLRVRVSRSRGNGEFELLGEIALPEAEARAANATFEKIFSVRVAEKDLWTPDNPALTEFLVELVDGNTVFDAARIPFGIRTFTLDEKGFSLNGKPFPQKLIGGNRHQDFAEIGNAVPNNLQWQDAVKLRAAGLRLVRCAHYPMDPAFMDACDRLGLFVIVATPGWQFWNNAPAFENRVYDDIRNMVRRDRNRPSVLMWEPILNESYYPPVFAKRAHEAVHEEFPFPPCYTASDKQSRGSEHYDVMYSHPATGDGNGSKDKPRPGKAYFCREFGDNVDSWFAHNSSSRVARVWGEVPMLVQAKHYLKPDYVYTCWDTLFKAPDYHIGGALWHPFDHQRGYHPDTFYGGIYDAFRQPKYSCWGFMAQRPTEKSAANIGSGPMVKIAHSGTPFSPNDVTVFSNCDEVRLVSQGRPAVTKKVVKGTARKPALPNAPLVFENAWDFQKSKEITRKMRERASEKDTIVAEGIVDGKVVCRDVVSPSRRPHALRLTLDSCVPVEADGSSVAVVIAELVDEGGVVKRLNDEEIVFGVDGAGTLLGAGERKISWGTSPVLIRAGTEPGEIVVSARLKWGGTQKPAAGTLKFSTVPARQKLLFSESAPLQGAADGASAGVGGNASGGKTAAERRAELEKVGADQAAFE